MSSPSNPLASEPLHTLPDILARSRIAAKYLPLAQRCSYGTVTPPRPSFSRSHTPRRAKKGEVRHKAPLGVIKCERNVLSEDRDPKKPHPPPTTRVAYWLYLASSLYNFLKGGLPPYNGDLFTLYSPNEVLTSKPIQRSWTLYTHEYTTLPAAGPVDVTEPQPEFPHWSRDVTVPPTLFHLAAAACLLEKQQPEYIVPDRQCFWYPTLLFCLLVGQDALDAEVEHDAKRVAIGDAYCSEASRDTSAPATASNATFHAHPGTLRDLFKRVTRKDIEDLRTQEELDAIACERQLAKLYCVLQDAMLDDRKRCRNWGPYAVPGKDAVIDALGGTILDMELEIERVTARRAIEADRIAAAIKLEAERAAAAKRLEAETAAAFRELEEETAANTRKFEAQEAAMRKELDAELARLAAETAAANAREAAAAAKYKQMEEHLAALTAARAAALARYSNLDRRAASEGAAPSNAAQV